MTAPSPNLSFDSDSDQRESTAQNWHQASLAIEAAYSRITQVRQDLIRLSNSMPDASSSSSASRRDLDPGHDVLVLSANPEMRDPPTGGRNAVATEMHWHDRMLSYTPYNMNASSPEVDSEFHSNRYYEGGPGATGRQDATTNPTTSPAATLIPNVLPPHRRDLASHSARLRNLSSMTPRAWRLSARDSSIRRDVERLNERLHDSLDRLTDASRSRDRLLSDLDLHLVDDYGATPLSDHTSSYPSAPISELTEQRWRNFRARLFPEQHSNTVPQNVTHANSTRREEPSSSSELDTYSGWRDQDFAMWLPSLEDRGWESTNSSSAESSETHRATVRRTSQRQNRSESRPHTVTSRRTDAPRRGWARLDSDGIAIPSNEEEELERSRTEYRIQALQRAREGRAPPTYVDTRASGYHGPVIYGSVMDAALHVHIKQRDQLSRQKIQREHRPHAPFYVDPLPMPLSSMETNPRVDDLYVDIVISQKARFAGR